MKKVTMIIAAALMAMTSCSQGSDVPAGQAKISVRLTNASVTRAVEDPAELVSAGDEVSRLSSGTVFVINAVGNVVKTEPLDLVALAAGDEQVIDGGTLYPADSRIYILGNMPDNVDPATLSTWDAISGTVAEIVYPGSHNTDYTKPAMANDTGMPETVEPTTDPAVMVAEIALSPLYARIELAGIEGGTHVKEFTVTGVWLDSYYPSFTLAGVGAGILHNQAQSTEFNGVRGDVDAGSPASLWISSTGDGTAGSAAVTASATDQNKVWAYHIGPGSVARFIARVSKASLFADNDGTPDTTGSVQQIDNVSYITVTGYSGGTFSGVFQRGKIYRVTPIIFNEKGDLTEVPNEDGVQLMAEVTVLDWQEVIIAPGI